ncbi:MAG: ribonuclease Z [Candidatus Hadarchaeum yellowstonense]|jgi:ribonuclease Z|uniref:Ribonuclease Z n=1 Tax=Hadarchaeum yellowstonense TaxID=1776334 RepID=A0A147JXB2_HADYE|nr:MAG: ribonuclease Z [Candidatus Hadarchaeum yellowstonense]
MKLVFLGTGGSIPTSRRGIPAIALKLNGELLLFDVAEGTQRQMALAHLSPMKVSSVFITHLHGDHFLGLAGLVQTMALLFRTSPLEVFCPAGEKERLENYLRVPHYTLTFDVLVRELRPGDEVRRRGYRVLTSGVDHPVPSLAYALVEDERPGRFNVAKALALGLKPGPLFSRLRSGMSVTLEDGRVVRPEEVLGPPRPGRKIVYSGDTRPTDLMIEFARGADVLIHDCTLGDELMEKAQENYHSTPRGAAEVARRAGVKQLVLMHISPRYEDDSILLEEAKKIFPNTLVAQDLMVLDIPLQEG